MQTAQAHRQLYPLEVNAATAEPFLRLPAPHTNIIITPPRLADAPAKVEAMNDPRVYETLSGPPFPYKLSDAESWLNMITKESDEVLASLAAMSASDPDGTAPLQLVGRCPVRHIREIRDDGSDVLIGDCDIMRSRYQPVKDKQEQQRLISENDALPLGDPRILWDVGFMLHSSHHGRGIMSNVFASLLREWVIPRMGVRKMHSTAFVGNKGSIRVFEKLGFTYVETVEDAVDLSSTGGRQGKRSLYCMERTFHGTPGEI